MLAYFLSRDVKKLTAGIESKVGPTVVEISLLGTNTDGLDRSHLTRRGSKFLEVSDKLNKTGNKGEGEVLGKTLVLAIAES